VSAEWLGMRGFPGETVGDVVHVVGDSGVGPFTQAVEVDPTLPGAIPRAGDRPPDRAGREVLEQVPGQGVDRGARPSTLTRRPAVLVSLYSAVMIILPSA